MSEQLAKGYEPKEVEERIYQKWENGGYFKADPANDAPHYSIVIPPPNVTGVLHVGHALDNTIQDILIRYKRMDGFNTLWQPGTDHAGIATQNVVEKQLAAENTDRQEVGREKFIERVWKWREEYGGRIINQLKRLGSSCDWSRERFTMDEGLSEAVREVFVSLHEQGLIYRDNYIINYCPRCHTALADLEVEHHDVDGGFYYIKYPLSDGPGHLTIATTRPETMLGDTAVAVHPEDERLNHLIGKSVNLPLTNREIPVIGDEHVDIEFGTGSLKITPAHDPNDWEIGQRHNLEVIKAFDESGIMNPDTGDYAGLDRFEARAAIVKDLEKLGLLEKIEELNHSVGHCYRCKTVIEPLVSKQWFVNVKPLAKKSMDAVRTGKIRILPKQWEKTFFEWMENIRPWCVSRQIWWGHRIPAWYCQDCGEMIVARQAPDKCSCGGELTQETDVLDTWFSSALWPFSTLGWPEKTDFLEKYYPTSCLVTGFDILFFWVARMMMMGIWFMDEVPFKDVYLHALLRDEKGQKMSKSKGNVLDPLEIMEEHGTDAFRFTLAAFAAQGRDIKLSVSRIEGYRNFINKIWNAARFSLMNLEAVPDKPADSDLSLADRWILSRLENVINLVRTELDGYNFDKAASAIYQFTWHEFCDWYIELSKQALYGKRGEKAKLAAQYALYTALKNVLKLLHPFIPFVTEEIWSKLPGINDALMVSEFPRPKTFNHDLEAEAGMNCIMDACLGIRRIRGDYDLPPTQRVKARVLAVNSNDYDVLNYGLEDIKLLAWVEDLSIHKISSDSTAERPTGFAWTVAGELEIGVDLSGLIDLDEEFKKAETKLSKITKDLDKSLKKLSNSNFTDKAPADVIAKERAKEEELTDKKNKLLAHLERLKAMRQ